MPMKQHEKEKRLIRLGVKELKVGVGGVCECDLTCRLEGEN